MSKGLGCKAKGILTSGIAMQVMTEGYNLNYLVFMLNKLKKQSYVNPFTWYSGLVIQ